MKTVIGWADKYHAGVAGVDSSGRMQETLGHIEIREAQEDYCVVASDVNGGFALLNSKKSDGLGAARHRGELFFPLFAWGLA